MKIKSNKFQAMAIDHGDGPCLVLSGPGSGKTYVLTNRIVSLIENHEVKADNILVITFTRASANEMQQRFMKIVNANGIFLESEPTFGTFHSVFYDILRTEFGYNSSSLINDNEEVEFLTSVLKRYKDIIITPQLINNILYDIKNYKLYLEREEEYTPNFLNFKLFHNIFNDYQIILIRNKKLDFSDMISRCYDLLNSNAEILHRYQDKYKYVLVDEFQDINKLQYKLTKLICKSKNIFVVGDDDQSIYKFRGSHPRVMADFLKDYKRAKVIYLNENYRCAKQIVKFSKLVIDRNSDRFHKDLISNRDTLGCLEIKAFVNSSEENQYIIDLIKKYRRQGIKLSSMVILYRTNLLSNSIQSTLFKNKINYKIKEDERDSSTQISNKDVSMVDAINLMTFHLSKGLEFDVVFIIDSNDGLIPHKKSIKDSDLETERRLFYVAMTRAKDYLHIFFTTHRFGRKYKPSRFILEAIGGQNG